VKVRRTSYRRRVQNLSKGPEIRQPPLFHEYLNEAERWNSCLPYLEYE
jgi:hypothetical protein